MFLFCFLFFFKEALTDLLTLVEKLHTLRIFLIVAYLEQTTRQQITHKQIQFSRQTLHTLQYKYIHYIFFFNFSLPRANHAQTNPILQTNLPQLRRQPQPSNNQPPWYHGNLSKEEANEILKLKNVGSYLSRKGLSQKYSLSIRYAIIFFNFRASIKIKPILRTFKYIFTIYTLLFEFTVIYGI